MKQQTFDNIDRLLEPKKLISIGILCLIAFLILWFMWRKLKSGLTSTADRIKDSVQLQEYMTTTGQSLTYTQTEYESMAKQLYTAMYGAGTDEESVESVFDKVKNDADVYKLISVFGKKKGYLSWDDEDLYEWIKNDGMSDEVNDILESKGITVRF